jgi:uncharacterized caspase-like protein
VQVGDLFFFGFSGHGAELLDRKEGVLYAADTRALHPAANSLSLNTLRDLLARLKARWLVLLVDACRDHPVAGKGAGDYRLGAEFAKNMVGVAQAGGGKARATAFLSACQPGQRAHEWPAFGHGVCSHYLLEGLNGPAWSHGRLTIRDLAKHAEGQLAGWSQSSGLAQQPWFEQFGTGDIVLGENDAAVLIAEAEARAAQARRLEETEATTADERERKLRRLVAVEAEAQKAEAQRADQRRAHEESLRAQEAALALQRKAEAEKQAQAAQAAAAAHRQRLEALEREIREVEARLSRARAGGGQGDDTLARLNQLLDEQERLAKERARLEAEAKKERERREAEAKAEQQRQQAARERERQEQESLRQAREAEVRRLKAAEAAQRKQKFERLLPAYQRVAASTLPAQDKREAWREFCRQNDVTPRWWLPTKLVWDDTSGSAQQQLWHRPATARISRMFGFRPCKELLLLFYFALWGVFGLSLLIMVLGRTFMPDNTVGWMVGRTVTQVIPLLWVSFFGTLGSVFKVGDENEDAFLRFLGCFFSSALRFVSSLPNLYRFCAPTMEADGRDRRGVGRRLPGAVCEQPGDEVRAGGDELGREGECAVLGVGNAGAGLRGVCGGEAGRGRPLE